MREKAEAIERRADGTMNGFLARSINNNLFGRTSLRSLSSNEETMTGGRPKKETDERPKKVKRLDGKRIIEKAWADGAHQ